jgi:tetratricopeptide (TPR) repeat protein
MRRITLAVLIFAVPPNAASAAGYDDLNIAISYFDLEQYDNAIPWFDKAIAANDLNPDLMRLAYLDRGFAYEAKKNGEKALADFTGAIAAQPDDMLAYRERIAIYLANNEVEKALADYEALRKLRPHDSNILMNIGWLNWWLNHIEASADAFSYFSQANAYAWLWLQLANVRLGRPMTGYAETVETRKWPGHITRFYLGQLTEREVLEEAKNMNNPEAVCFAYVFTAMWRVVHNDQAAATPLLQTGMEKCNKGSTYWNIMHAELDKIAPGDQAK